MPKNTGRVKGQRTIRLSRWRWVKAPNGVQVRLIDRYGKYSPNPGATVMVRMKGVSNGAVTREVFSTWNKVWDFDVDMRLVNPHYIAVRPNYKSAK